METRRNLYRTISFLTLLLVFFFAQEGLRTAHAFNSKAWKERLSARTATLWIDGQFLGDGIVLNARGELNVTWLERGLSRFLNADREVDNWVVDNLNYYFSRRKETRDKLKGRDVFVLNYRAIKNWSFDPSKLTIGGYTITPDDILTGRIYWESELTPGYVGSVAVAAPSLKTGQTVELRYEDAEAQLVVPRTK